MKWSKEYDIYFDEIKDNVYKYAYSNYIYDPIISQAVLPEDYWFPEILNVSDLDRLLHSGIKETLISMGLMDQIKKKGYDKFIVTPDVFSESDVQIDYPHGHVYDMDKRNVIYMNNKLFEIIDNNSLHSIKLNYNNKTYIFYKSGTEDGMLDGINSKLELITFQEYSFIDEDPNVEDYWDKESRLVLKFSKNRKLYINDENPEENYVSVGIMHPYLLYNYHEDFNDGEELEENPRLKLYGLKSFNKDMQITEKQYLDDKSKFLIHNTDVIFSSTAVVIYKDKSFIIENFKFPYNEHIIERYDKHTIEIKKDDNIDKIIIFLHPVSNIDPKYKVDTIYNRVQEYSSKAYMLLKKYNKKTNDLLDMLEIEKNVTIEDLIEFGYKYDRDVLKIIQASIPMYINIPLNRQFVYAEDSLFDKNFLKTKIIIKVQNRIKGFPQLIINSRFVSVDYKIIKRNGFDYIILDPIRTFNINPNDINKNFLNDYINKNIKLVEVCFITDSYYTENSRRPFRVLSDPRINKRIHSINTFVGENPSLLFCNGRLSYSEFINDPNYKLNYGLHRVPILNNIFNKDINEFYNYKMNAPFGAKDVGYTKDNKTINILDRDKNHGLFLLDITKEGNLNRTSMVLNLGKGSYYGYKIFDNIKVVNEEGYVNKIEQSRIDEYIAPNQTVFFDYDGLVIKPEILSEHYIDTNYVGLYNHTSIMPNINTTTGEGFENRNGDTFCVHFINLEPVNDKYGLDLRIDESRIDKHFNSGSYNENVMKDPEIIRLFSYYPKEANKTPISTYANDYEALMNMKNYVSFWYAFNNDNKLNNKQEYLDLVLKRNTLFNSNGTPIEDKLYTYFKREEHFNNKDSLFGLEIQIDIINNLFKDSSEYFSNKETIDLNNVNYTIEDNAKYSDYINVNNFIMLGSVIPIIVK